MQFTTYVHELHNGVLYSHIIEGEQFLVVADDSLTLIWTCLFMHIYK